MPLLLGQLIPVLSLVSRDAVVGGPCSLALISSSMVLLLLVFLNADFNLGKSGRLCSRGEGS
jgi:hypothetical protein